ncbi:hypothetical protein CLV63_107151 [Murinocardiopsis flavida]|uniref:Uncharacterized protein n=1 Tax=Murinocardiopsis flavida TaxID=645275 RepID=A0A2P8DKN3_9ACTN|nr:hypothetical protein [Murinocardiopsis flavida]PSK97758.1 hypothetical protein CLV63_107151 [Murinocardiopsis flavida]
MVSSSDDAALAALRERYGDRYGIRRAGSLWVANPRRECDIVAPTITEDSGTALAEALDNPPLRAGRPLAALGLGPIDAEAPPRPAPAPAAEDGPAAAPA